jgi:predicted RNA methylase
VSALVRKESIEELCGHRARAIELYVQAFDLLTEAGLAVERASPTGRFAIPETGYRGHALFDIRAGRDEWARLMRQAVDRSVWTHLAKLTELEKLMDRQAHDEFRKQLDADPPEATPDNCFATLQTFLGQADDIFKRGIANVFSALDRRFRSHDGFKVGSRIILSHAFSDTTWNYSRRVDETLRDIERTFRVLDGKTHVDYKDSFVYRVSEFRRANREATQFEDEYFRLRWFWNGNAHIYFLRDELVEEVNRLLAEYYGAALGDARQRETFDPKREAPAKNDGDFFETPIAVVDQMLEAARLYESRDCANIRVLEPSAGLGRIAHAAAARGATVVAVEQNIERAAALRRCGAAFVHCDDFFDLDPSDLGMFDAVLMNPPFSGQRDIEHVTHAWNFVKPGGVLVAIMSAGVEFSTTKRAIAFRALVESNGGSFRDLPAGSFREGGTMVNTVILTMRRRA